MRGVAICLTLLGICLFLFLPLGPVGSITAPAAVVDSGLVAINYTNTTIGDTHFQPSPYDAISTPAVNASPDLGGGLVGNDASFALGVSCQSYLSDGNAAALVDNGRKWSIRHHVQAKHVHRVA